MKYVAWHSGQLLSDTILDNIIHAAKRGKMTDLAKKLLLVPDRRYGRSDEYGLRPMKRVKKSECKTLKQAFSRYLKK